MVSLFIAELDYGELAFLSAYLTCTPFTCIYLYDFLEHPIRWRFRTPFCTPTYCSQRDGPIWQVIRPDSHLHVSFCLVASWCSLRKNRRGFTIHLVVLLFLHGSRSLHCRWTQQHAFWWVHMGSIQTTKHPPKVCLHQEMLFFIFRTGRRVLENLNIQHVSLMFRLSIFSGWSWWTGSFGLCVIWIPTKFTYNKFRIKISAGFAS